MTNSERGFRQLHAAALTVCGLLACLGASLGVIPGSALAQGTGPVTSNAASPPGAAPGQTGQTAATQAQRKLQIAQQMKALALTMLAQHQGQHTATPQAPTPPTPTVTPTTPGSSRIILCN